ncbi:MAG: rhodanese-like domain-containing protein [Bacteroidaceae bacterium]|nr:rhodanese-like domain-containing protein [Bacteroidaceae bacterium]
MGCKRSTQTEAGFESVDVKTFNAIILNNEVQCVDVRTAAEHNDGHIPGSINIDVLQSDFAQIAEQKLIKNQPVAIYCRSGNRSKKAGKILMDLGFQVIELNVGYNGWGEHDN